MSSEVPSKIGVILKVLIVFILVSLVLIWLFTGGIGTSVRTGQSFFNPVAWYFGVSNATGTVFHLPWGSTANIRGPDISEYASTSIDQYASSQSEEQRASVEGEFAYTADTMPDPRTFGNPSPNVGRVSLVQQAATETDPSKEYLAIIANGYDTPVQISGWSLQSAVTGTRVGIPLGASYFFRGIVNTMQPITLEPGASAILTSGVSPVGTSFQENICVGYLSDRQSFTPDLPGECPSPSDMLPVTAENIRTYGAACIDFVSNLQSCIFPTNIPTTLSSSCRAFVTNTFSYNGCVQAYRGSTSFTLPSWRIFLGSRAELWQNTHDVIRLLDEQGRIVDVLTY